MNGKWHWIKVDGDDEWFPAIKDDSAAGGWTNGDTWENFERKKVESAPIPFPEIKPEDEQ